MKPLARRAAAVLVSASLLAAQWPASAWAGAGGAADPTPAEAMKYLRSLGVYKDDADPLKTYFGSDKELTPIGRMMYLSLKKRYNAAEEVESMKPVFERLRGNGEFTQARQDGSARAMKLFVEKFGDLDTAQAGSVEESFRIGALREALMTGAAVADPPKANAYLQVEVNDGFEFWDAKGLAFRMTKNQVTTYNRELQKTQRQMNLNRPAEVAAIPETGRYNYEMLEYSYWRLKNQETEYIKATRVDRMIAIAELLGKQYPTDMWFNEKGLEEDLIRQAKAKTYDHRGETYSVFDIVEAKFTQRRAYLEGARFAVQRFETDMHRFKASNTITDSQVATMSLNEQNALRWLSLTVLETQMFHVKNQRERVDPTSPDAQAIMKMIDESDMSADQKSAYKGQGVRMKERLDELRGILDKTRRALNNAAYASSLDSVQAALASTQKELGDLSVDYSIYLEAPSTAFLAKGQTLKSRDWYNLPGHLFNGVSSTLRGGYKLTPWGRDYAENMRAIEGDGKSASMARTYTELSALVAKGDFAQARQRIMAMNPDAAQYSMSGTAGADPAKVNDALRISSSLRIAHDRIGAVAETNKSLDAASTFVTYAVSIALLAPMARSALNGVGRLSGVGGSMIQAGKAMGGVQGLAVRAAGRSLIVVGEIAKHSAARLESLEPDVARVRAVAGETWIANYAVASGARALSVATRQATFTGLAGGISAGFTVGTHLWDMAAAKVGGVNIGGWQAIEPGHSMFSEDWDGVGKAAAMGFKGGAIWANESFHPLLGYIGLPSTIYGGTRLAGAMDVIGTRGVVGSLSHGVRVVTNGKAGMEAAAASGRMGLLERLASAPKYTGKPALAFGLSMADNVSKYVLFSQAAGFLGQKYADWYDTNIPIAVPFFGVINHPEEDVERRMKRINQVGHAWLESPAWLLLPTHAAHGARDAGPYMQTREGMRQYDAAGRTKEYANAAEGATLKLTPVKPPVSQRLFEARFFGRKPVAEWIVTKQAKEAGQLKEVQRLAREGGEVNPLELMAVRDMVAGKDTFRTLHVTEEVQKVSYEVATEGLVAQSGRAMEAMSMKPGGTVKGWGKITPEIQIEIAKALYRAEVNLGRTLQPNVSAKVREVLKDHLQANLPIGEAGKVLRAAVVALPNSSPKLDAAQKEAIEMVLAWETAPSKGKPTYAELTMTLRANAEAKLQAGQLSPKEAKALTALYDYIITGDKRFNSFNRTEIVKSKSDVIFEALRIEYAERPEMLRLVDNYSKEVDKWASGRNGQPADGPAAAKETKLSVLIERLQRDLKVRMEQAPNLLGPSERAALESSLTSVNNSAWVVRDAKGGAIPSWRPKQFVRLMQSFLGEGSHAKFVKSTSEGIFKDMRAEHKGSKKMTSAVDGVEADVMAWVKSRETATETAMKSKDAVKEMAKLEATGMSTLIERLETRLTEKTGELTPKESVALQDMVSSIRNLDREGLHMGILSSGREGKHVQLFVKAPTSLGKTLLAYEGLLPYLEAEAAATGRKVMFLTFNTKLQAQAEFDFLAFNKLGSTVKFETYEGLKTMIAEGKSKGLNKVEEYLLLQDEMDAAGQQPALTIGMVSGRVTRLNGQTTAIMESNAGLSWGMGRLNTIRVEAAEVQAQRIQKVTSGLSEAHIEKGRLGKIKVAADDVLQAVGQLRRAKGAAEIALAEKSIETGMGSLRRLIEGGGLPAAEAEAASTILSGLNRMTEALAERPASNPAIRAQRAAEMETAFLSQNRLMNLTNTLEGLNRLPAEARKARVALEAKIERLTQEIATAEASGGASSGRRATLLREQLEFARVEKTMIERFDGVDASARLISVDAQISAIRSGQVPAERLTVNSKLGQLMRESVRLEKLATPESAARRTVVEGRLDQLLKSLGAGDAAVVKAYRAETGRAVRLDQIIEATQASIKTAKASGRPAEILEARLTKLEAGRTTSKAEIRKLETNLGAVRSTPKLEGLVREAATLESGMTAQRRAAHQEYRTLLDRVNNLSEEMAQAQPGSRSGLESERATARGRLRTIELELSAAPAKGDLGGTLRRINILSSEAGRLEAQITSAAAKGERTGGLKAELKSARKEEAALRREARAEIIKRFDDVGADIVKLTREGQPGWDAQVTRLLERRKALQEAYAGDESAMYAAYRKMKEHARPIGENPRLTEKPYEVPGGEGMEPGAALKRADFLIDRARRVEAKPKGGTAGRLEGDLVKARSELEALAGAKESPEYFAAMDRMRKLELELLRADSFHTADVMLKQIDGAGFLSFLPSMPKFLWQAVTGKLPEVPTASMGLTRYHAAKMLEALAKDPLIPPHQRDNLMWSYLGSMVLPKGLAGRGSYIRSEIINMVQGFHDSAAGVRVDNKTGRFNVVHNGQWFESMDNASRRWWELEYGTDLTLPYTHNSMSTIKDVTTNKKSYFISLSGTSGNKFEAHLRANKISVVGEGSAMPKNVLLEVVSTPEQRLARVVRSLETQLAATRDQVVLRETDIIPAGAKKSIETYLSSKGMSLNDPQVIKISEVPGAEAQAFLHGIRATQKNTGLIVLSVSDTRALRKVEGELKKAGVKQSEIAKVFADTEYLRLNVPEANVLRQMNIEGLNTGQVKVLILDTRVGGRGLDLNFKGERGSTRPGAFRGYTQFEMLVLGPEEMSAVHMIQAMGRIDTGRTLNRAPRKFSLLMDVETAKVESVFRTMFEKDPFFVEMRKDPAFQEFTRANGGRQDWRTLNEYLVKRANDGSGEGQLLSQRADKAVRENLGRRNLEVEENLLRQANVLTDAPTTQSKNPALDRIR
ncbi:MAG: hypothetical protein Q8T11_06925 [Elusimicrobiota bacterium]|nr:hypothetical protein [Elusimicrobiota bacterium]